MSRQGQKPRNGMALPLALQQELGIDNGRQGTGRRHNGAVRTRKDQRKAERQEKRQNIRGSRPQGRSQATKRSFAEHESDDAEEEDESEDDVHDPRPTSTKKFVERTAPKPEAPKVKSILKRPRQPSPSASEESSPSSSRSNSPGLVLDSSSRAFRDRAAQDDAEIAALERKLGLGTKKSAKSFEEDGLDDLLAGLEPEERGVKRKSESQEWLERKRRKAGAQLEEAESEEEDDEDTDADLDGFDDDLEGGFEEDLDDEDAETEGSDADSEQDDGDDFEGFDSGKEDEEETPRVQPKKVRENPYLPPVSANAPTAKYIPPSLRKAQSSEGPSLERLKRQLQGHLNKLSEANLVSILGEIEKIYQSNPRQDVTTVLIDLLLTLFYNTSALQNTFVILHAAFAAAVYKVVGVDFGAELLSQLIDRFDQYHSDDTTGKEALNLTSLLANLFTFQVIGSAIIFEHIRLLLGRLSENNTELLLRLIRDCGPQLRQDDPSSLKDIIQLMQKEAARMNSAGEQMSVRTKFTIEMITDLKNNKMKAATSNAGLSSEHITQMRKALGSLNSRSLRASEPLRITRDDIKNSDRKGKWWLVGASWKGNDPATTQETADRSVTVDSGRLDDDDSVDLVALSRQYGMNTDVRRSIFIALLSAVDHQDAHVRLLKLRLKRNQEQEIPKVLLRCAAGEKPYNPYYTQVAKRLCLDKRMRKAFQFALWGFFRRLGENPDAQHEEDDTASPEEDEETVEMSEIANIARLFAHLILDGAETLGVLKVLDLAYIKERTAMFLELLLVMIMTDAKPPREQSVGRVFARAVETPQIIKRLQFFVKKNVRRSDLVDQGDREAVRRGCKAALETLKGLGLDGAAVEE